MEESPAIGIEIEDKIFIYCNFNAIVFVKIALRLRIYKASGLMVLSF